ncbi:hypothetical protein ACKKBF_B37090 [Auxenochlorella protothecoides x Auxenochlorella symbiontica]
MFLGVNIRLSNLAWLVGGFTAALFFTTLVGPLQTQPVLPSEVYENLRALSEPAQDVSAKRITAFVGIQTGFTTNHNNPKYNYENRREALRATWAPSNESERSKLETESGIVARFVVGHSPDSGAEAALNAEEAKHGGFMRLDLVEGYADLPRKTLLFFETVLRQYDPQYIVKVDDDVYLRLDRVPAAVEQWASVGADYIGCMKNGQVIKTPRYRWYEPSHALLGSQYFTHTWGSAYVVSRKAAALLTSLPAGSLRHLANEDVTLGAWMLALNLTHHDDRRMCSPVCSPASLATYDYPSCAGLCNAAVQLRELHTSPACGGPALTPTGALPILEPAIFFNRAVDPKWEAKALSQMARQRRAQAERVRVGAER